jgi:hypothetical protein
MDNLWKWSKSLRFIICMFLLVVFLGGCASNFTMIAPTPPQKYEKLGKATGTASGALGMLATAYYFIPLGLNSRVEQAYEEALKSVPGATALIDVTIQESWFWWVLGTSRTVTITGEAIREVK